jgi:hypothetical protein
MTKDKESKITNEKPVKIPLGFRETLTALLNIKPQQTRVKSKKKKPKPAK